MRRANAPRVLSTNRQRALASLVLHGPMHRADLARRLGVSRTTATNLASQLADLGWVVDEGVGLKSRLLLSRRCGVLVSLVFMIDETVVVFAAPDGRVMNVVRRPVEPSARADERIRLAKAMVCAGREAMGSPQVVGAHVAVNTQIDVHRGDVLGKNASSMWHGVNVADELSSTLATQLLLLENSARLTALAEYFEGPGAGCRHLVYVHLARGITLGQVVDGRIVQGAHGGAGELGHVVVDRTGPPCSCGNRGCLMHYVAEDAVARRAEQVLGHAAGVTELIEAAETGHRLARAALADIATSLGWALANVCNLLDPDVLLVGGALSRADDCFLDPLRRTVLDHCLPLVSGRLRVAQASAWQDGQIVANAGVRVLRARDETVHLMMGGHRARP